ncbi:hypothetical protein BVX98_03875 [bacterium F11]|nr:hypothetical protein BVX98_03875 [bacterium F11]
MKTLTSQKCFLVVIGFMMLTLAFKFGHTALSPEKGPDKIDIVLTSHIDKVVPETSFFCSSQIIAYATFPPYYVRSHKIEGYWNRPDGFRQEHTNLDLEFKPKGSRTAFLWIQFEEGTSLDAFRKSERPDEETQKFNGTWTLDLLADGEKVGETEFEVQCP